MVEQWDLPVLKFIMMNNNKKILLEISRIRQMMGLGSVISEGPESYCPFCVEFFSQISKILSQASKIGDDVNVTKQLEDIRSKIDSSGLNLNQKSALKNILDDVMLEYKGTKSIRKLQDDIKLKIKNDALSDVVQPNVIVKNIIDTDLILKDINFATELFDSGFKHKTYKSNVESFLDTVIEFANKNKKSDVSLKDATIAELDSFIRGKYATDGLDATLIDNLMVKWKDWFETLEKIKSISGNSTIFYKSADDRTIPIRFGKNYESLADEYNSALKMNEVDEHFIKPLSYDEGKGYSMENFSDSKTLRDYLDGGEKITQDIADKIKNAVNSIHEKGLCHGDLNTNNILIKSDGSDFRIIDPVGYPSKQQGFTDFDLAKADDISSLNNIIDQKNIKIEEKIKSNSDVRAPGIDANGFLNLINQFVESSDPIKRVTILKFINKTTEQKEVLTSFITKYSNNISQSQKIVSLEDLFDPNKSIELTNLAKSIVQNKQTIVTLIDPLLNKGRYPKLFDFSKSTNPQLIEIQSKLGSGELNDVIKKINEGKTNELTYQQIEKLSSDLENINKLITNSDTKKYIDDVVNDLKFLSEDVVNVKFQTNRMTNVAEKFEVKQVSGVKINKEELENIKRIVNENGYKVWGWNINADEPIYKLAKVNGETVRFTLSEYGPRRYDGNRVYDDKIFEQFQDEYSDIVTKNNQIGNYMSFEEFLKNKFKNNQKMMDLYFPKYKVLGGVRMTDDSGNIWVITNPVGAGAKKNVDYVTFHEMAHVDQKSGIYSPIDAYRINEFETPQKALEYLDKKIQRSFTPKNAKTVKLYVNWDEVTNGTKESAELMDRYLKETGNPNPLTPPGGTYVWAHGDMFNTWAKKNEDTIDEKYFRTGVESQTIIKNLYSPDVKKRTLLMTLEETRQHYIKNKQPTEQVDRLISKIENLDTEKLNLFLKNNVDDPLLGYSIKRSAHKLSYFLNIQEIEADFTALIRELMDKGTNKENIGFASWLVEYLKKSNKLETLSKLSDEESLSKQIMMYITNLGNINKNKAQKYANNTSSYFWEFLNRIESEYKKVYPDDTQKLYSKLYKQAYEIISKGFPVVAGVVFAGKSFLDDDKEITTENTKRLSLLEIFKNTYNLQS